MPFLIYFITTALIGLTIGWWVAKILSKATISTLQNTIANLEKHLEECQYQSNTLQEKHLKITKELGASHAHTHYLEEKIAEQGQSVEQLQRQLTIHFKNLAHELLEEKVKIFRA